MSGDVWAIIGAGMGGKGLAAQLAVDGARLRIHDIDDAQVAGIRAAGGLHVKGRDRDFGQIERATTDLAEAVRGASVLFVSIYANDHPALADQLAPLLEDGQAIVLVPGHFGGALVFRQALDLAGCTARVDVAEMDFYPYMLNVESPDTVLLTSTIPAWQLAAFPASRTGSVLDRVGHAFPGLTGAPSVLHTSFAELSGIFHVGAIIVNVGRVEGDKDYRFYDENMTPSVVNLLEALDEERVAVARAYGIDTISSLDWINENCGLSETSLYAGMRKIANTVMKHAPAPRSMQHRYFAQDVPCMTVPLVALADAAGVPCEASRTAVQLSGYLTKQDYMATGRNIEALGLKGKSVAGILAFINA
jgi:opine dehydrogenase